MQLAETSLAADVARVLDRLGISFILVGATALAVRGLSRGTHDIDFMTASVRALGIDWASELGPEADVDVRKGDLDDPLAGVVRLTREGSADVDLVVARWDWQRRVVDRCDLLDLEVFTVRVPDVADLVLLKVDAGSPLDQRDAAQLIEIHGEEVIAVVDARAEELPESTRRAWRRLKEELVRRD